MFEFQNPKLHVDTEGNLKKISLWNTFKGVSNHKGDISPIVGCDQATFVMPQASLWRVLKV